MDIRNQPISMSKIEGKSKPLYAQLDSLNDEYDSLIKLNREIATITYKLEDFINYGMLLSAKDRTFLFSLGINF